jgi:predicted adenine nucleotide alpha hydrolase (AANH) superfamily ATPase
MKVLLHACCAPCAVVSMKSLMKEHDLVVFYYNPCIIGKYEYAKRKAELVRVLLTYGFDFIEGPYNENERESFFINSYDLENEEEGGARCAKCFHQRLELTAKTAKERAFDAFATSLAMSPYKNRDLIEKIGKSVAKKYNIEFITDGILEKYGNDTAAYKESIRLSEKLNLYRQRFCGCVFSMRV